VETVRQQLRLDAPLGEGLLQPARHRAHDVDARQHPALLGPYLRAVFPDQPAACLDEVLDEIHAEALAHRAEIRRRRPRGEQNRLPHPEPGGGAADLRPDQRRRRGADAGML
jgi:hypothetical protein